MRHFVLVLAALEVLIWIATIFWNAQRPRPLDLAGLHGFMVICTLPALGMALANRWLRVATGLVCVTAFIMLSMYVGGMISS